MPPYDYLISLQRDRDYGILRTSRVWNGQPRSVVFVTDLPHWMQAFYVIEEANR